MNNDTPAGKLKDALGQLYASKERVENAFIEFESQDLPKENENLRDTIKTLILKLETAEKTLSELQTDHALLENNFKEELKQKRAALLSADDDRMRRYLSSRLESEAASINRFTYQLTQKLNRVSADFKLADTIERAQLQAEADALAKKAGDYAAAAQKRMNDAWNELLADKTKAMETLQDAEIENSALRTVKNFFNFETFFGLKLISSLGILLIIIGVFTFGRYIYFQMNNTAQCASIFAVGLIFLACGEILNKKWRGVFSFALTAGGSGILFLAAALGYLTLQVLPMAAALGICAGVSVVTFVLAIRHNSQIISVFALIGGYLPILALEPRADILLWCAVYLTILNLFALALATRKNWRAARFIGLFAGIISEVIIIFNSASLDSGSILKTAVISVIALAYAAYLIIPVFGAVFTKTKIKPADIALLSCNVFFRFVIGLYAVYAFRLNAYDAFVPVFFALTCVVMALLSERGPVRALFFVTSVTFSALVVLFAFDRVWFSSGWLIEGVGLLLYGLIKNRRQFNTAGAAIGILCFWGFVLFNVTDYTNPLFVWQYLLLTLGAAVVAVALAVKYPPYKYKNTQFYHFFAALNVWIFVIYVLQNPILDRLHSRDIVILSCIIFGMAYSYVLPKIKPICCGGVQAAGVVIGAVSFIWLFVFNAFAGNITQGGEIKIAVMILYILANLVGVFRMRDLLQFLVLQKTLPLKFYPLALSGYFVLLVSQNLVVQLELQASSMVLTFIFGVTALGWIIFGFLKRNGATRISGLSLSFFAVAKLFVLDLSDLSTELRIVSYFTMGIILLAISFIYQYFNKKLK